MLNCAGKSPTSGTSASHFLPPSPLHHVPPDGLFHGQLMLETWTNQAQFSSLRLRGGQVAGVPPTRLTSSSQLTVSVFTLPVIVLLIYQKVWEFGMLFQFALFIYDDFVIVFYTFGFINYVNVKMSISKKSVKLWPKKPIRCIFKKESPGFINHRYKLEIL